METAEEPKCPKVGLLHHVLSVRLIASEPGYRRRPSAVRLLPQKWRVCFASAIGLPVCTSTPSTIKTEVSPLLFPL
jgi:hypothetical protein